MAANDLCALADVKSWLNISVSTDDVLLGRLITAASEDIRGQAGRNFDVESYTEVKDGQDGQTAIWTRQWPIITVASLIDYNQLGGQPLPAKADNNPATAGYTIRNTDAGGSIRLYNLAFTDGEKNIVVQYQAGYASVPADLAQGCIDLVAYRYTARQRIGQKSKSLAGENVTYATAAFPDEVISVINRYMRKVPV